MRYLLNKVYAYQRQFSWRRLAIHAEYLAWAAAYLITFAAFALAGLIERFRG